MAFPKIGTKAPAFNLLNQEGESINLSSFLGEKNVVVYFYPKALTPGCTTQACGVRDNAQRLQSLDTVVLGMSPDPVEKLKKFQEKHDLNFDLLSDEGHAVADKYGVWALKKFMGKEYMGIIRTSFLIDKQGKLRHVIEKVKTKSHHDDICDYIEQNFV